MNYAPVHGDGGNYNNFVYAEPPEQQYMQPHLNAMPQIDYHQYPDYMHANEYHYPYHNNDIGWPNYDPSGYMPVVNNNGTAVMDAPQSTLTNGVNHVANTEQAGDFMSLSLLEDMAFESRLDGLSISMDEIKLE